MEVPVPQSDRSSEYWSWAGSALFLLLTVDLLTTLIAANTVGIQAEANPIVRWALERGVAWLVLVNLSALLLLGVLFFGLIRLTLTAPKPYDDVVAGAFELWIGLLIASGLLIFANNLLVIVYHRALVSLLGSLIG
ncbi:MAG: hypothetical protein ABEJ58_06170 [Halodesulfurarchaeum sp.]